MNNIKTLYFILSIFSSAGCNSENNKSEQKAYKDNFTTNIISDSENKKSILSDKNDSIDFFSVASSFIDKPYVAGTLDIDSINENLIVNLDSVDCTTFLEYVTASLISERIPSESDSAYLSALLKIRYKNGVINEYPSRLHYFSSWIDDNQKKGIIKEVTESFIYEDFNKKINFMSSNPQLYSQLRNNKKFIDQLRNEENYINGLNIKYIPKNKIASQLDKFKEGDLIAITTSVKGLDISHVGFIHIINNVPYLMHASSGKKKVVITSENIYEYLKKNKSQTGIRVLRLTNISD